MSDSRRAPEKAAVETPIPCITRKMQVAEVLNLCPEASDIMAAYGLHCFSCSLGGTESLGDGCGLHGFDDETIDALIEDLNEAVRSQPKRPAELHITPQAAAMVRQIAEGEGRSEQGLAVISDASGGFCMEFRSKPESEDFEFTSETEATVKLYASPVTLWRIGGAVIDFRDGRFKLDLPEDAQSTCGCTKDTCHCRS